MSESSVKGFHPRPRVTSFLQGLPALTLEIVTRLILLAPHLELIGKYDARLDISKDWYDLIPRERQEPIYVPGEIAPTPFQNFAIRG